MVPKELILIQQNDTHGSIELHDEYFWEGNRPYTAKVGGYSRVSKYVKDLKKKEKNVLFLDGGDLFHGTAPLVSSKGASVLPALQAMPLDGFVPGNWDFAYGKEQLKDLLDDLPFEAVACNARDKETNQPFFSDFFIKELQDLTVGVIGLTYPYEDEIMPESFSEGLEFSLGIDEVREIVGKLKNRVDLIVLNSHMGLPLDVKLASIVKGIDIILSGHTHDRIKKPIIQDGTIIVQSGASSSFLGRLDIKMEDQKIIDCQHHFMPLSSTFEEDPEMNELIVSILAPYQHLKEEVAGYTNTILHRMTLNEAPMDKLITDAYLYAYDCDAAFSHGWRYGIPISSGPITSYDLHSIIPTDPEIFTLEIGGDRLIKALEKNLEQVFAADPFDQKGGYILRSSGIMMAIKPYNPKGSRIQEIYIGGEEVNRRKTYKIAGAGGQLFKGLNGRKTYTQTHSIDIIRQYLATKQTVNFESGGHIINV